MFYNPQPQGYRTAGFGPRPPVHLSNGQVSYPFHSGYDIGTNRVPTPFYSAWSGTVVSTSLNGVKRGAPSYPAGAGNYAVVYHDASQSPIGQRLWIIYAHASAIAVSVGQQVRTGELLGVSGATGGVRGLHLHVGVAIRPSNATSAHINPERVIDFSKDPRSTLEGKPAPVKPPISEEDMSKTLLYRHGGNGVTMVANFGAGTAWDVATSNHEKQIRRIPGFLDHDETRELRAEDFELAVIIASQSSSAKEFSKLMKLSKAESQSDVAQIRKTS